jgi:hypothetical protein
MSLVAIPFSAYKEFHPFGNLETFCTRSDIILAANGVAKTK